MMTDNCKQVLQECREIVAQLPDPAKQTVEEVAEQIRALVAEHGALGKCAVALIGAELAAEDEG